MNWKHTLFAFALAQPCGFVTGKEAPANPSTDVTTVGERHESSLDKADQLLRQFKLPDAITAYTRLIEAGDSMAAALVGRGRAHMLLHEDRAARKNFTAAIKLDKACAPAYAARAELARRRRDASPRDIAEARRIAPELVPVQLEVIWRSCTDLVIDGDFSHIDTVEDLAAAYEAIFADAATELDGVGERNPTSELPFVMKGKLYCVLSSIVSRHATELEERVGATAEVSSLESQSHKLKTWATLAYDNAIVRNPRSAEAFAQRGSNLISRITDNQTLSKVLNDFETAGRISPEFFAKWIGGHQGVSPTAVIFARVMLEKIDIGPKTQRRIENLIVCAGGVRDCDQGFDSRWSEHRPAQYATVQQILRNAEERAKRGERVTWMSDASRRRG